MSMLYKCETKEFKQSSFHASCEEEVTQIDVNWNYCHLSQSSMAIIWYHMISKVPTAVSIEIIRSSGMWWYVLWKTGTHTLGKWATHTFQGWSIPLKQTRTDRWSNLWKVPTRKRISHTYPMWLWGHSLLKISSPGPVFMEPSDFYDAPIFKVLHFIRSVRLIKG
jgi:hypothetical protein